MVSRRLICSSLNNKHVSQGKYWISLFYCKFWLITEGSKEKFKVNIYFGVCLGSSKARCPVDQIIHFHCPHYPFVFFKQHFTRNANNSEDRKRVNQTIQLLSSGQICLHRSKSLQTTAFLPDPLSSFPLLQLLTTGHSHHAEISTGNFIWVPTATECQSRRGRLTQEKRVSAENQSEGKGKCHSGVLTLTVRLNTHPILVCGRGSHPPSMYVTQGAQGPTMLRRVCVLSRFKCVWLFATLWTVARTLLSMGFSRQEYCSGSLFPCSSPQFKSR